MPLCYEDIPCGRFQSGNKYKITNFKFGPVLPGDMDTVYSRSYTFVEGSTTDRTQDLPNVRFGRKPGPLRYTNRGIVPRHPEDLVQNQKMLKERVGGEQLGNETAVAKQEGQDGAALQSEPDKTLEGTNSRTKTIVRYGGPGPEVRDSIRDKQMRTNFILGFYRAPTLTEYQSFTTPGKGDTNVNVVREGLYPKRSRFPPLDERTYLSAVRYIRSSYPHYGPVVLGKTYTERVNEYNACRKSAARDGVKLSLGGIGRRHSGYQTQSMVDYLPPSDLVEDRLALRRPTYVPTTHISDGVRKTLHSGGVQKPVSETLHSFQWPQTAHISYSVV